MADFEATQQEKVDFGVHKKYGWTNDRKQFYTNQRPTNGKLMYENGNEKKCVDGAYDKPWALLNSIKTQMIKNGYDGDKLKLRNL